MAEPYRGRLELTWTNKELSLLAHEDGSYEWVPPTDYRVAEVRLLREAGAVGDVSAADDNLLIRGDALSALTTITELPQYAERFVGKVRLAYLDPPFNTQQSFLQYDDALEHSVWLTMMRDRLLQIRKLLAPDGSVWVHCDDYEQAHLRVLLDELFGREAYIATVVWQNRYSRDNRPAIGTVHNYLHVYAPAGSAWKHARNRIPRDEKSRRQYRNPNNDPSGPWRGIPLDVQAGHATASQFYEIETPGGAVHSPSPGRAWSVTRERLDELIAQGRVYFGANGRGKPNLIRYLKDDKGLVPWTWWPQEEVGHNDEAKKEILSLFPDVDAFATPKPERLMERIIGIATDPGDIVLDCFLGSGTTAAVAHKMRRSWVGIERRHDTLDTFAIPRLSRVITGDDNGGVTDAVGWTGGGGMRILDVGPSMFDDDEGVVVLADWATNSALAEATAAQLGYAYDPDAPFCGRKGRSRLAVVDGLVSPTVIDLLIGPLGSDELLTVCGTSVDDDAATSLRGARPGSRVRKIPASLLSEYQDATRWRPRITELPRAEGRIPAAVPIEAAPRS